MCLFGYVLVKAHVHCIQMSNVLELELQVVVKPLTWVLRIKLIFFARAVYILNPLSSLSSLKVWL